MDFENSLKILNIAFVKDEPMSKHTGYGVGGNAKYYIRAKSLIDIKRAIECASEYSIKVKVFGLGTNILVSDKGYDGVIISTEQIKGVEYANNQFRVMCGTSLREFIKTAVEKNHCGLEGLIGIPASVGGAIVMNAGAFCHSVSDFCVCVQALINGKLVYIDKNECKFGYRKSRFLHSDETVLSAIFSLPECEDKERVLQYIKDYTIRRKSFQPNGKSCGSVFKNPEGDFAGRIIDSLGLKGYKIGGAEISPTHANFIITHEGAFAKDVKELIDYVKLKVSKAYNINLTEEIETLGEF